MFDRCLGNEQWIFIRCSAPSGWVFNRRLATSAVEGLVGIRCDVVLEYDMYKYGKYPQVRTSVLYRVT